MPGYLLHVGATVLCMHGGQAQATVPIPRVLVSNQPVVGQTGPYVVAGCSLVPPPIPPCVSAQWVVAATRVTSGGVPLVLQDSTAVCTPTGTGLQVLVTQLRVKGT
ncbi:MAG TPA: hypothetical protein VH419_05330 [Nocardioidaceae bacterium]